MPEPKVAQLLQRVAAALKPLGVRWYVFGAQAVIAAGVVRFTADLDITTEDVPAEALRRQLGKAGFVLRRDIAGLAELVAHHRILPLEDRATGFHLDVVRAGPGLEEELLSRAVLRRVGRMKIPFVSTSDLVALKVIAGREKDLEDVRALLRSETPELDVRAVRSVLERLASAIDDSTLVPLFEQQLAAVEAARRPLTRRRRRR